MLLKELIIKGTETISSLYPDGEAKEMVYAFLEHHIGTKRHTHIMEPMYEVVDDLAEVALAAFQRMASGEPLQYIIGKAWFYNREFKVSPDVLIPRPETEVLVSEALSGSRPSRVLDLCTGSGCIAWTLALEMPGTEVVAVDVSYEALKVASSQEFSQEMAKTGALAPEFIQSDVLAEELGPAIEGKFDILVSNPPYVMNKEKELMRVNVLDHEPHLALFVPDDDPLLFYRAIAGHASRFLSPEGFGLVEINEALGEETADVFRASGFEARVIRDLSDKDRFVRFEFMKK
jgi:release factor glutamine methyltransferase